MNDYSDTIGALEPSMRETARALPGGIYPDIYLPDKLYEALPAAYVSIGGLFVLGSAYIGIGHWTSVGYLAMGLTCIFAGVKVHRIRRRERSKQERGSA